MMLNKSFFLIRENRKDPYTCINVLLLNSNFCINTVMILSFRTDRSGQTVQTQIRQSDQGLYFLQFRLHLLDALLYSKASLFNFRVTTANFLGVRIFRSFTVNINFCINTCLHSCVNALLNWKLVQSVKSMFKPFEFTCCLKMVFT